MFEQSLHKYEHDKCYILQDSKKNQKRIPLIHNENRSKSSHHDICKMIQ